MATDKKQHKKAERKIKADQTTWWQKAIKVFGVEAPILLIIGVVIGIIFSYIFMISKPDLFIQPAISYAVRETVQAQNLATSQYYQLTATELPPTNMVQQPTSSLPENLTPTPQDIIFLNGQQLIYDDFSSTNLVWSEGTAGINKVGYDNGTYYLELKDPISYFTAFLWSVDSELLDLRNFAIQVDILGPLYTDWEQKQGIVFGYKTNLQGTSYAFDISYNGDCRLVSRNNEANWEVEEVEELSSFDKNAVHTLTIVINGATNFYGYVDNQLCIEDTINYTPGITGVVGKIAKDTGKLFFDNFYVYEIP